MTRKSSGEIYAQVQGRGREPEGRHLVGRHRRPAPAGRRGGADRGVHVARCSASCTTGRSSRPRPADNRTVGVYSGALGFGYNKDLLAKNDLPEPKCWADLIKPEYKGQIQIANPNSSGTAYTMLATMVQLMGEDKGFEYLKALHKNVNQYTKSGSAPIKAAGLGETTVGIVFMHDAVAQTAAGFPIVPVAPCEGTGYEIGSMSIIKGARNPDEAKKFYDWALTADVQSRAQDGEVVPAAVEQGRHASRRMAPDLSTIKLIDYDFEKYGSSEERKRLLQKWDDGGRVAAAIGDARPQDRPRALHPTVVLWMAVGLARLLPCCPGTALDGNFFTLSLAVRRLSARRATSRRRCSSSLQGQKLWLAPLGLLLLAAAARSGAGEKSDPLFGRLLDRRRRGRPRLAPAAGLRHRPARLALRLADRALRRARRPPVRHGLRRAADRRAPSCSCSPLGLAARGAVGGDVFVVGSIGFVVAVVALFIFMPIVQMLASALRHRRTAAIRSAPSSAKLFSDRLWGLGCLAGGPRCGVAWNSLFLAVLVGVAHRRCSASPSRWSSPAPASATARILRALTVLPIITPPFVIGLALILLFGLSGVVTQALGRRLRHAADALGLRPARPADRAGARLHADRLPGADRRRRGRQPVDGGGGADAARQPLADLRHRHRCR